MSEPESDVKVFFDRFYEAYQALRDVWIKTGGGMDMEIKIRDSTAELSYQHRREAAKKRKSQPRV
jgi:hypothetical protein